MKASVKFRGDVDQPPLVRTKVPIHVLGLPFRSAVSLGAAPDLRLDLTTAFDSFPAFRFSYRPADPHNPFSLVLKSGTGALGSPFGAHISMSAEFSVLRKGSPTFLVHFRPKLGDFCLKRLVKEESVKMRNEFLEEIHSPGKVVDRVLSGTEIMAMSVLPMKGRAAVNVRWGVRVPPELNTMEFGRGGSGSWCRMNLPHLVMSKISIEYFGDDSKEEKKKKEKGHGDGEDADGRCFSIQRQLDSIRVENGMLRKAMEDFRLEFVGGKEGKGNGREDGNWSGGKGVVQPAARNARRGEGAVTGKDNVNEELKKALMGASGASA